MSYNTKNYTEQGGEKTVIGGTLEIKAGATVTGLAANPLLAATDSTLGGIKAATKEETDTILVKIGTDDNLYVPTYPVVPDIPVVEYMADSVAEDLPTLLADFNALLAKLKTAGLMAAEPEE
jgi:hypothetical protein